MLLAISEECKPSLDDFAYEHRGRRLTYGELFTGPGEGAFADTITALQAIESRACKTHTRRGESWESDDYDNIFHVRPLVMPLESFDDLANLIADMESDPRCFIIRGEPIAEPVLEAAAEERPIRRLMHAREDSPATFRPASKGRRWIAFDLDDVSAPDWFDPRDGDSRRRAARWAIEEYLTGCFHGAACYVQWTASAGVKGWGKLRLRLWFWADRKVCGESLAENITGAGIDPAIWKNPVQPHYVAAPIFKDEAGNPIDDPFFGPGERSFRLEGAEEVVLPDRFLDRDDWERVQAARRAVQSARSERSSRSGSGRWQDSGEPEDWRAPLEAIPADLPEPDWMRVLTAFARAFGDDAKELCRDWSAGDPRFTEDEFESKWSHCLARAGEPCENPVTMGTVMRLARVAGYRGANPGDTAPIFERGDDWEMAAHIRDHILGRVVYDEGELFVYDNGVWAPEEQIERIIGTTLQGARRIVGELDSGDAKTIPVRVDARTLRDVRYALEAQCNEPLFFAGERPGVAFRNGFLAINGEAVELLDPCPDNRCRFALDLDYDPQADCPRWRASLERAFAHYDDGEAIVAMLAEFFGAMLFGKATDYQRALMLVGKPRAGKSAICDVIRALFPPHTISAISPQRMGERFGLDDLPGKRVNIVEETPAGRVLNGEVFKSVVVGGGLQIERKGEDSFDYAPKTAHLFAANDLPEVPGADPAFWRRWLVVRFERVIPEEEINRHFARDVVEAEGAGIVNWAIEGLQRLIERGEYAIPASCVRALDDWRGDADSVSRFAGECLERVDRPVDGSKITDLHSAYKLWHGDCGGRPVGRREFRKRLEHAGFTILGKGPGGADRWNVKILPAENRFRRENKKLDEKNVRDFKVLFGGKNKSPEKKK